MGLKEFNCQFVITKSECFARCEKKPFTKHQKIYSPNDVLKAQKKKNDLERGKKVINCATTVRHHSK
jgi:hypothetical protein